jgi:addiction module HigA family antidote
MAFKYGGPPIHPGEVLREEYLKPLGMSENELATHLHVSVSRINDIVNERRGITADTALRLARYFGGDAQSWMNLQGLYDLRKAEIDHAESIREQITPAGARVRPSGLARETGPAKEAAAGDILKEPRGGIPRQRRRRG